MTIARPEENLAAMGKQRLSINERWIIFVSILIALIDGFDTLAVAYAAPWIQREQGISAAELGLAFSSGVIGGVMGALPSAYFEKMIGRRKLLIACLLWFSLGSIATSLTSSGEGLIAVRLIAGVGLGMAVPLVQGGMTDTISRHARARALAATMCAIPAGGLLAGVVAAMLVPSSTWHAVFYFGAVLPLLAVPLLYKAYPSGRAVPVDVDEALAAQDDVPAKGVYFAALSEGGLRLAIILATIFFYASLAYSLLSWMPSLLVARGAAPELASIAAGALNGGAMLAYLIFGYVVDRNQRPEVAIWGFLIGAGFIVALGQLAGTGWGGLAIAFMVGVFSIGTGVVVVHLLAHCVRPQLRVAAVSIATAFSRAGGAVGPFGLGLLIQASFSPSWLFACMAAFGVTAAAGVMLSMMHARNRSPLVPGTSRGTAATP